MIERIIVAPKPGEKNPLALALKNDARDRRIYPTSVSTRAAYTGDADVDPKLFELLKQRFFVDPVNQRIVDARDPTEKFDFLLEVSNKPGVTDPVGKTIERETEKILGRALRSGEGFSTSRWYLLSGVTGEQAEIVASLISNPIIEATRIFSYQEVMEKGVPPISTAIKAGANFTVNSVDLNVSDAELLKISKERGLSLSLGEMQAIRDYFKLPQVIEERKRIGIDQRFWGKPTDLELEAIAQTWSEHCKHKIFNAIIEYYDEKGNKQVIDSIFRTFIKEPSTEIAKRYGWVASAFSDNAGIVRFSKDTLVAIKVETHNAPSVLVPFGGAITGILGVIRDVMGAGVGAKPILNTYFYCFGDPFYKSEMPEGLLHPRIVRNGVHRGVSAGGNESGIPLITGSELFGDKYAYRPIIFCGSIGTLPPLTDDKPSESKRIDDGDLIIMAGGRVGKDGIHGATFSSAQLDKSSPVQAVQIGDSITQKMMSDFLIVARDLGYIKFITDNGAGGLSSSIGEMAKEANGARVDLEKVPLKYQGLAPWEIFLSESQERMSLAVDPKNAKAFLELAGKMGVEATVVGRFENTGRMHIKYGDKTVGCLDLKFLHEGFPRMRLEARLKPKRNPEPTFLPPRDMNKTLEEMLARENICSKETKQRQYDHEVGGRSIVKPLVGKESDVPSDASVSFLRLGGDAAIVAEGINPQYSYINTYHMTASAIDEAVRRVIAVGGKMPSMATPFAALDNFCCGISSLESEDGKHKLAELVMAAMAVRDYSKAYGLPFVSGKDSMHNVWKTKYGETIAIPLTLLVTASAKIDDPTKAITMDVKKPGDIVYVAGTTYEELGGSEYFSYIGEKESNKNGCIGNKVPKVHANEANNIYTALSMATEKGLVASIHTPTIGGLGVAFAQSAFAGGYGISIYLYGIPYSGTLREDYILFSESNSRFVVTVPPEKREEFERVMKGTVCAEVGKVTEDKRLRIYGIDTNLVVNSDIKSLKESWEKTLKGI